VYWHTSKFDSRKDLAIKIYMHSLVSENCTGNCQAMFQDAWKKKVIYLSSTE
jgi:hypothetical protein